MKRMSDNRTICSCSKASEIETIQKDIRDINKDLGRIREVLFDGLKSDVSIIRKAVAALQKNFQRHELAHERTTGESSGKRKNLWRILGTVVMVFSVVFAVAIVVAILKVTGILSPQDIAAILGALTP